MVKQKKDKKIKHSNKSGYPKSNPIPDTRFNEIGSRLK